MSEADLREEPGASTRSPRGAGGHGLGAQAVGALGEWVAERLDPAR